MRIPFLLVAVLGLSVLTACTATPEKVAGPAGPAGSPVPAASPSVTPSAPATSAPSKSARATVPVSASRSTSPPAAGTTSKIRRTNWADLTLVGLNFMGFEDARFRNGKATSGPNTCTMLPGGARPAYAEFLAEEPADSPITEDALVLIECGSDGLDQVLVPVQLGFDQTTRQARGLVRADRPAGPDKRMTFLSYSVRDAVIVTTVRKADGSRETRRYRFDGGQSWDRF